MPVIVRCSVDGCGRKTKLDIPDEKCGDGRVFYMYGYCEDHDPIGISAMEKHIGGGNSRDIHLIEQRED